MARGRRRQAHPGSIRNLLFLLLLAALVPVLLVQAAIYYQESRAAREDEFLSNLEVARAAAGLFESYLRDVHREETAVGEALLQSASLSPARANRFLTNVDKQYPAIAALNWINPRGRVLASSIPKLVGQDWGTLTWFRAAAARQDSVVTNVTRSSQPGDGVFIIASAVHDDEGVLRGVVAAAIDPDKLTDRLRIDRARSGAFSITDKSGWLVYRYPPARMTMEQREWGKLYAPVRQALAGKEGFGEIFATYESQKRFISTTPIKSIGWVAGAGRPSDQATAPIRGQISRNAIVITGAALLAFLLASIIAKGIAFRIQRLSRYAARLGEGELDRRIEESGPVEMVSLARALNFMAGELQQRDDEREQLLRVERERAENAGLLEAIQEHAQVYLAYLDTDLTYVRVNNAYCERAGMSRADLIGRHYEEIAESPEAAAALRQVREAGEVIRFAELAWESKQRPGFISYWDWAAAPVRDEHGSIYGIVVSVVDVTEHVRAREERLAAERMRAEVAETVAAEINHRMKNNLMLLASVLQMQLANQPPGSQAAAQLRDAIGRISSLSVVHEHLYEGQPGQVELTDVMKRIGEIVVSTFSKGTAKLSVSGDVVYASSKAGAVIAMVANELITNAIKHGATDDGDLEIDVNLLRQSGKLRLTVWNAGNEVDPRFDVLKQHGLGLRLVHGVITGQLGGTFVMVPHNRGTLAEAIIDLRVLESDSSAQARDAGVTASGAC
jgi:PAS domain S-box-containing protein